MVKVKNDLTGSKFHRLTVVNQSDDYVSPSGRREAQWLCKCDCGNITIVRVGALTGGYTKSCGCLQKEAVDRINKEINKKYNKYDLSGEYGI